MKLSLSPSPKSFSGAPDHSLKAFGKQLGLSEWSWVALASLTFFTATCISIVIAIGILSIIAFKLRNQEPLTCIILATLPIFLLAEAVVLVAQNGMETRLIYMLSCWGLQLFVGICATLAFFAKDRLMRSIFVVAVILIFALSIEVAQSLMSKNIKSADIIITEMDRRGMIHTSDHEGFHKAEVEKLQAALNYLFYPSMITHIWLRPM